MGGYSGRGPVVVPQSGGGFVPAQRAWLASQQRAAAQAAAAKEAALRRRAESNQKLWEAAQKAEQEGDVAAATRLYRTLALRRPVSPINKSAQDRLTQIQSVPLEKLKAIEDQLAQLKPQNDTPFRFADVPLDGEQVTKLFDQLDELAIEYAGVATVENRIDERRKHLRNDRKFAEILQEPPAAELWKIGQELERKQQACCALLVYEQAAALGPAPSAKLAKERMAKLEQDQAVVAAGKLCRVLQSCHEDFQRGESLRSTNPAKAREYFAQILERAPADTPVHRAAREQIASLQ